MREYQSNYTGEQVDEAIGRVLTSVGKGGLDTPVYIDAEGEVLPIIKLLEVEEGSDFLVTSDGIHKAIVASEETVDAKIEDAESRFDIKLSGEVGTLNTKIVKVETDLGVINQTLTDEVQNLKDDKQDKLTAGVGIEIKDNVISNTNISAEWGNIEGNLDNQTDLKDRLDLIQSIAEGRNLAEVFENTIEMNQYIAQKQAAGEEIPIGFIFYIRDLNEPNYWWDGTRAVESKQQKIDLTEYATKEYVGDIADTKQNTINDLAAIRRGAGLGATALQEVPEEYVTETELSEYHDSTKQDKLEVIQLYKD